MVNVQSGQGLTLDQFKNLNYKERHAYTEERMQDRIKLPYNEALKACRHAINSDEKLTRAFQNFQEMKNELANSTLEKEILAAVFVDKFKERIFFVVLEKDSKKSHYVFEIPSKMLVKYPDRTKNQNDFPSLSNIGFSGFNPTSGTYEHVWRTSPLSHRIGNIGAPLHGYSNNQEYVSDEYYKNIEKAFKYLDNYEETNYGIDTQLLSYSNPAHSTIDPDDLINEPLYYPKNARNA